ncbi:MAG TPA: DUF2254 domain-containing protein [Steroidobacteraceae bacterium]|nr:DUF2254 domain-containing protein [Steroidobacteraceae bacterium]
MHLVSIWVEKLRTGLWPIPLAMSIAAMFLYSAALAVDGMVTSEVTLRTWHLHSGSGDDARNTLSVLVSAIITMSSVVFSITIVVLSNASNQFGTRLIRTYMADVRTKLTLGLLSMTITYCLLALRGVQKDMPSDAVPHIAVGTGWLLGLSCVLVLLFFLHFVSRSIVADRIIRRVADELLEIVAKMEPLKESPRGGEEIALPEDFSERNQILRSRTEGYIEAIRYERLLSIAAERNIQLRMEARAGAYMCRDGWLARAYPGDAVTEELATLIDQQVLKGASRTPTQDLEFMIRHLVDIALRALSPGINDENTSIVVIDHLRNALSQLACKQIPLHTYCDKQGVIRVVGKGNDFAGVLDAALNQIRQAADSHPAVIIEMIRAIGRIGEHVLQGGQRDALQQHARLFMNTGLRASHEPYDRAAIERAFANTEQKLCNLLLPS